MFPIDSRNDAQSGFTLIEVLLAASLLVLVLIPVMRLMPMTTHHEQNTENDLGATFLATQKLEELKLQVAQNFAQDYTATGTFAEPCQAFAYRIQDQPVANSRTLTVTVWYDADNDGEPGAEERSATLMAYYRRRYP